MAQENNFRRESYNIEISRAFLLQFVKWMRLLGGLRHMNLWLWSCILSLLCIVLTLCTRWLSQTKTAVPLSITERVWSICDGWSSHTGELSIVPLVWARGAWSTRNYRTLSWRTCKSALQGGNWMQLCLKIFYCDWNTRCKLNPLTGVGAGLS